MINKEYLKCPVCDEENFNILYEPWEDIQDPAKLYGAASGVPGTQQIVACKSCEMLYENPRYPEEVILQGYMSSEEGGHDSQYEMRVDSFYRALRKLAPHLPQRGSKILDIGTAGGGFLEAAGKFGYDAFGLEPSAFLVNQGKSRGLKIEQGTIDSHGFSDASFDLITLWDVIEHLTQPRESLEKIHKLLKPDGVLLINYPDIGTWQAKLAGKRFWWILSVHLHHFSKQSIKNICEKTGYEAFYFKPYWQTLKFGYLQHMATVYKIPLSEFLKKITPACIQNIPVPYYASQTTALARIKK